MDKATVANIQTIEVRITAWPGLHTAELATFKLSIQKEGKAIEIRTHYALEDCAFPYTSNYLAKRLKAPHLRLQIERYMQLRAPNDVLNGLDLVQMATYIGTTIHTEAPSWNVREKHCQCSAGHDFQIRCGTGPDCPYQYNSPTWTFHAKQGEILDMKTYVKEGRVDIWEGWKYVAAYAEIP